MFFADEDDVTFGIQGSNVAETMQISSTTDDVFMRFFTNSGAEVDNLVTGFVIGSSNFVGPGPSGPSTDHNLYMGYVTEGSNIGRVLTLSSNQALIAGHVLPATTLTYDLGSPDLRFRDAYLSGNTIYLADATLRTSPAGEITPVNAAGVPSINVTRITTEDASSNIDFALKSLSNIDSVLAQTVRTETIYITNAIVDTLTVTAMTPPSSGIIDYASGTLSNVNLVDTLAITNLRGQDIDLSRRTLSNVYALEVRQLTAPGTVGQEDAVAIDVTGRMLSNVAAISVALITTDSVSGHDFDAKALSNVGDVRINPAGTLFVDKVTTASGMSGSDVRFLDVNVVGIRDLHITGDLSIRGEFNVMETTTCNTNQLRIDNDGTGPALIVNTFTFSACTS